MYTIVSLAADQCLADHPFADPQNTLADSQFLTDLLAKVRSFQFETIAQKIVEQRIDGRVHRYVINNLQGLLSLTNFVVVGFCGQRRREVTDSQIEEIDRLDREMLSELERHPGILLYVSAERPDRDWGNLILFERFEDLKALSNSLPHMRAAKGLSPDYYYSTRIHDGVLEGTLFSTAQPQIRRTRYWNFCQSPIWCGERYYR